MHVIIGFLTAVAGLIWAIIALQRSGFDINALNPFLWMRRSQWKKKYCDKPICALAQPLDVAALLLLGVAKCEGEISVEQKKQIVEIYQNDFRLDKNEAADLLLASSHLLRDEIYLLDNLDKILQKSASRFSREQIDSLVALMQRVARIESAVNEEQGKLINATGAYLRKSLGQTGQWA